MGVHSATKALPGHCDVIAGVAVGNKKWMERVQHMVIYRGGSMDPEAAYLLNRGIKTLGLRVQKQCENAMAVAGFLEKHPKVARAFYPRRPSHPDHTLAKKQIRRFRSMVRAYLYNSLTAGRYRFVR